MALNVYFDYLEIMRTNNGGVSHLAWTPELWDDTVYMIGVTLLAMYRASGDEKYLTELIEQYKIHKEKLLDETTSHIDNNKQFSCSYFFYRLFYCCCFFLY